MITVPQAVEKTVRKSPFLEEALARKLINLSELARVIKPGIEEELLKDVSIGSIVMALKRLSKDLSTNRIDDQIIQMFGDISVRSSLMEFTYANSDTVLSNLRKLLDETPDEVFLTWTRGIFETTIILSSKMEKAVEKIFIKEKLKFKITDLSSLAIKLPPENIEMPGVYYMALKLLAWEGISITDAVSTATELTIILPNKHIDRAFSVFNNVRS